MSDFNSSLPIKTESAGDVQVKLVDGTITSQSLAIDSSGRITTKNADGAGNALASSTAAPAGTEQALIVRNIPSGTQTIGGSVTANAGTNLNTSALALESGGNLASVKTNTDNLALVQGSATSGQKGSLPLAAVTTAAPTYTTGQSNPLSMTTGGALRVDASSTTLTVAGTVAATQSGTWSQRLQDGLGNAITSSAAGSTRPLDTALRDAAGVLLGTATNPISVAISADIVGAEVASYNTAAAIAAAATSNHVYTVTAGKTLLLKQIEATASGKAKIEVQVETGVATGVYTTKFVQFNSTATPNMSIHIESPISVAAGVRVQIIRTNKDNQAQDLYSTVLGQEV